MLKEKANEYFASNPDAECVCVTSDGSVFDEHDHSFADAHSQRLEDPTIQIFAKNENFKNLKERLFFEGSKWVFELIVDFVENKIAEKKASKVRAKKAVAKLVDEQKEEI